MKRYVRNIALDEIDIEGQEKLLSSTVLVIGAGGLGCHTLYHMASLGIKNIIIMDDDVVSISNLQRQILFNEDSVGKNKAKEAAKRLNQYNSEISVYSFAQKFSSLDDLIKKCEFEIDLIMDCTDNFESRILISKESQKNGNIPVCFASVGEFQGWVLPQFYKTQDPVLFEKVLQPHENDKNCDSLGVISPSVSFVASIQAMEGLKLLLNMVELEDYYLDVNCFNYQVTQMVF